MNIKIKKHFLVYKGYKIKCCIGKSGISSMKKEGDLSTPKGIFKLGSLYYRKDRINTPKCKIKKRILLKKMGWGNDSKSKNYNKEIKFPFKYKAERLYRKDGIYDLFINIKYNFRPVIKKKGSAIFLHLSDDRYKPTEGCVAITKKDFLKILPLITKDTKISIG